MSRKKIIWLAGRGILLVIVGSLIMACATSTSPVVLQQPHEVQKKSVLETCAVVQDKELAEMRGCYDIYSFGLNITADMNLADPNNFLKIKTTFDQAVQVDNAGKTSSPMPSQVTVSNGGSLVKFSNANVAYTAGIGQNSLGAGSIMNVVQVSGVNVMVLANLDVTFNINNSIGMKSTASSLLPGALSGVIR